MSCLRDRREPTAAEHAGPADGTEGPRGPHRSGASPWLERLRRLFAGRINLVAAAILVLVVGLRIVQYVDGTGDAYVQFRVGDERYYHAWAAAIAGGKLGRGAPFFTSPLYAYALAGVQAIAGGMLWLARLLNVVLGVATTALVYLAARRRLSRPSSTVAMALYGLCVAPIYYETFAEKTALVAFLTAASLLISIWAADGRRWTRWLLAGIAVGIAALAHAMLLVLVPAALLHLIVAPDDERPGFRRRQALAAAVFIGGCALAVSPATLHNYLQDGGLVLIASNAGQNFYTGNHAGNRTGLYTSPAFAVPELSQEERRYHAEAERRTGRTMSAAAVSRFWMRQGWREIRQHPRLGLARYVRKLRWAVGNEELTDTRTFEFYRDRMLVLKLPLWGFGTVSLLGILGCLLLVRRREHTVLVAFVVTFWLAIGCFFVYGRYRVPLLVPLSIAAAALLSRLREAVARRRPRALLLLVGGGLLTGWLAFSNPLPGRQVSFLPDYYNQGNRYRALGRQDLALVEYEKAVTVRPGDHPAQREIALAVAELLGSAGRVRQAAELMTVLLSRYPGDPVIAARLRQYQASSR